MHFIAAPARTMNYVLLFMVLLYTAAAAAEYKYPYFLKQFWHLFIF